MGITLNEYNKQSKGGTELSIGELQRYVNPELLKQVQIIPSRARQLEKGVPRILWIHDLVGDPEFDHLRDGGHKRFDKFVFVSNWQMQQFIGYYGLPWEKCVMLYNAIEPITPAKIDDGKVRLIYHTTPHRGLAILIPVFEELVKRHKNLQLDVYSSFKIYGWDERDKQFQALYERAKAIPGCNYHGARPNEEVRQAVAQADIFAYPSVWQETGCRSLMEAMSAECLCVHSNLGALYETAGQFTWMYHYTDNHNMHAEMLYHNLNAAIDSYKNSTIIDKNKAQKWYADSFYSWSGRAMQWNKLLETVIADYKPENTEESFVYVTSQIPASN